MSRRLTSLVAMGARWYATYQDGNVETRAPTVFAASMPKLDVIAAIQANTPDVEVAPEVADTTHPVPSPHDVREFRKAAQLAIDELMAAKEDALDDLGTAAAHVEIARAHLVGAMEHTR